MKSRLLHFIYAFLPFLPFVSVFFQYVATSVIRSFFFLTFFCSFFPLSFLFPFLPFLLFLFLRLLILIFPSFPPYHRSLLTLLFQCICILLLLRFPLTITAPFRSISVIHSYLSLSLSLSLLSIPSPQFHRHISAPLFHSFTLVPARRFLSRTVYRGLFTIHRGSLVASLVAPRIPRFF